MANQTAKNNSNNPSSLPPYWPDFSQLKKNQIPRWKIGLGIGGVFLLLAVVLFSQEIGDLLRLIGSQAQKAGAPQITLFLDPIEDTGGPSDTKEYTINVQIEHGTYLNPLDPTDPLNGTPLPFLGTIDFNVTDLVGQYPEFIESAVITVPAEGHTGDNPDLPSITVLDDINAFGLYKNRRLTPADNGFITTPPILTIVLKDYPLADGGGSINFQVGAVVDYDPRIGTQVIYPIGWIPPVVSDPIPADGILHLEGAVPDFTLEVIPETYIPDPISWGDTVNFKVKLTANHYFSGNIDLSSPDLEGYKSAYLDLAPAHPNGYTFSENPVLNMMPDEVREIDLALFTKAGLTDNVTLNFIVIGISGLLIHSDNGIVNIAYTPPPQDFHLTMDVPDPGAVGPTGSSTYKIHVIRDGYLGPIILTAESDKLPAGQLLADEAGVGTATFSQNPIDTYTLTVTADGTVFNGDYPFYVRGHTDDLNGSPADRWAPNNPLLPNEKNSLPAYFRIQSTAGYDLLINPDTQPVTAGGIADYTVTIINRINGFNDPVVLTHDVLPQYSDFIESAYFTGGVQTITITDSTHIYLDTKTGVSSLGLTFTVSGISQLPALAPGILADDSAILVIDRAPNFHLTMDTPTDQTTSPTGSVDYIIRVIREAYLGPVTLTAENLSGQPLANETGIGTAVIMPTGIDIYTLTVTADGTVFNGDYPFYVRGHTDDLNGSPADRWAPNNPLLPDEKNSTPAYFRIQSTAGYSISILPDPAAVDSDAIATYTVKIVLPINGFGEDEPVLLTQDILNLNSTYLEDVYFEGGVDSIITTISDLDGVLLYLDTKPGVGYDLLPGLPFTVNGHSQVAGVDIDETGMSHLIINRLPDPDFDLSISPNPHTPIYWGDTASFTITLTSKGTPFSGNVQLTSNELATYKTNGYLTDYTFNDISTTLTVAVSPAGPTIVTLKLMTTSGRIDSRDLSFTVNGVAAGISDSAEHHDSSRVSVSPRPPDPDFTLTVNPPVHDPSTIYWGDNANFTVTLTSENGFTGNVQLTSTQLATFKTNGYLTDYTFNGVSTTLTVALSSAVPVVNIPLQLLTTAGRTDTQPLSFTVRGVDIADLTNIKTGSATVTVTVRPPDPDFKLSILPNPHTPIYWGDIASFTITLTSDGTSFNGNVQLASSQLAGYKTSGYLTDYTFNDISTTLTVAVSPAGPTIVTLKLMTASGRTDSQNLTFIVDGVAAGISDSAEHHAESSVLVERVPLPLDFTILVTPPWQEVNAGEVVEYTVKITRDPGFIETVQLTNNLISDFSDYVAQATFNITDLIYGVSDTAILYVTTKTIEDSYLINDFVVTGTAQDGSPQHSWPADLQINVVVVPPPPPPPVPDFTIKVSPDAQAIDAGGAVDYTVTVTPINNFTDRVILTHNLLSEFSDYIANVDFDALQLDQDNGYTTTMHVTTKSITNSHILTFTVTGTAISGSPIRADNADLQINVAGTPPPTGGGGGGGGTYTPPAPTTGGNIEDFTVQVTPLTNTTIYPGETATYQITIIRLGGFTGPVTLSTDVLQLNYDVASATFGKTTIPAGETATTLLLVARPNAVIDSSTIFNVQGSSLTLGERNDDAPIAIVIPRGLPSTGPATPPSPWFWLAIMGITWLSWVQLHASKPKRTK